MPDAPTPAHLRAVLYGAEHAAELARWARQVEEGRHTAELVRLGWTPPGAARPDAAWDEEAAAERAFTTAANAVANDETWAKASERSKDWWRLIVRAVLGDHPPVKPDREDIYRAWHGTDDPWGGCADSASIERVLDLWPGESRATVQAEALRDVVEKYAVTIPDALGYKVPAVTTEDLLDRADRLAAEGGAS